MPGTVYQELYRLLSNQKANGETTAWVAPENLRAFMSLAGSMRQMPQAQPAMRPQPVQQPAAPRPQQPVPPQYPPQQPPAEIAFERPLPPPMPYGKPKPLQTNMPPDQAQPVYQTYQRQYQRHTQYRNPAYGPGADTALPSPPLTPLASPAALDWEALHALACQCKACRLYDGRLNLVFEDGCRKAKLMFIGEGPGEEEDKQGKPFVGRAGQMLTRMITAMGFDRDSQDPEKGVYIANIVKCRPPGNRNPEPDEGNVCIAMLKRQIELVSPKAIVLLGAVPLNFLMGRKGITAMRGNWLRYNDIPVMPTFHPAYLLRFERQREKFIEEKRKVWADLQQVMALLKQP